MCGQENQFSVKVGQISWLGPGDEESGEIKPDEESDRAQDYNYYEYLD